MTLTARVSRILVALVIAATAYFAGYRPLQINWGATQAEIARPLPGDELVAKPLFNSTRAVTVAATPERIWPWIAQIAEEDVGWYSFDAVDNGARESARTILPGHFYARGDVLPLSGGGEKGFYVEDLRANEWMLCTNRIRGLAWVFSLDPLDATHTRMVSRIRMRTGWVSPIALAAVDVGDFVMLRQMLNGIRDRAEGRPIRSFRSQTLEFFLWVACFAGFVVAEIRIVVRQRWMVPAIVAVDAAALTVALVVCQPPVWVDAVGAAAILGLLVWDWGGRLLPTLGARPQDAAR
jgi:hypothetical protein